MQRTLLCLRQVLQLDLISELNCSRPVRFHNFAGSPCNGKTRYQGHRARESIKHVCAHTLVNMQHQQSELFDFQSVPLATNDDLPYAPLLTGDQAITNSNSDRCHGIPQQHCVCSRPVTCPRFAAREQFLTKLVKYNDLTQALVLSVPWGFSPDKVVRTVIVFGYYM